MKAALILILVVLGLCHAQKTITYPEISAAEIASDSLIPGLQDYAIMSTLEQVFTAGRIDNKNFYYIEAVNHVYKQSTSKYTYYVFDVTVGTYKDDMIDMQVEVRYTTSTQEKKISSWWYKVRYASGVYSQISADQYANYNWLAQNKAYATDFVLNGAMANGDIAGLDFPNEDIWAIFWKSTSQYMFYKFDLTRYDDYGFAVDMIVTVKYTKATGTSEISNWWYYTWTTTV
jgi:hypothetical protein